MTALPFLRGSSVELIVRSISNPNLVIYLASVTVNGQKVRVNSVCGWHRRRAAGRFWEECADRRISGAAEDCGHHNWRDCGRGKGCCHRRSRGGGSVSWHAIPYPGQERKSSGRIVADVPFGAAAPHGSGGQRDQSPRTPLSHAQSVVR